MQLCAQRQIPLIFLQNVTGFMVGRQAEAAGIARNGAKLVMAVANAKVPKITVIIGGSYGAGNYGMCGRAYDPDFLFMWPNAKICVMGPEQAAGVLTQVEAAKRERDGQEWPADEKDAFSDRLKSRYEREAEAPFASARLWDDGIIDPADTRQVLALSLAVARNGGRAADTKYGVFRM